MKILVEFIGFPTLHDLFPAGTHPCIFPGNSLSGLVEDLILRYGETMKESLIDQETKKLDQTIQVRLNCNYLNREEMDLQELKEGDSITFLKLLAGG